MSGQNDEREQEEGKQKRAGRLRMWKRREGKKRQKTRAREEAGDPTCVSARAGSWLCDKADPLLPASLVAWAIKSSAGKRLKKTLPRPRGVCEVPHREERAGFSGLLADRPAPRLLNGTNYSAVTARTALFSPSIRSVQLQRG